MSVSYSDSISVRSGLGISISSSTANLVWIEVAERMFSQLFYCR
jgi:hypothetical protein